jgi:hypothetical protein
MTDTMDESLNMAMKSLVTLGRLIRSACGRMTRRKVSQRRSVVRGVPKFKKELSLSEAMIARLERAHDLDDDLDDEDGGIVWAGDDEGDDADGEDDDLGDDDDDGGDLFGAKPAAAAASKVSAQAPAPAAVASAPAPKKSVIGKVLLIVGIIFAVLGVCIISVF